MNEQLPLYQCHKQVRAAKIAAIEFDDQPIQGIQSGPAVLHFENAALGSVAVDYKFVARNIALKGGGYYVVYEDGYASFSPAKAFEDGYTLVPADFRDRIKSERAELARDIEKLGAFIDSDKYKSLSAEHREAQSWQYTAMTEYRKALDARIRITEAATQG